VVRPTCSICGKSWMTPTMSCPRVRRTLPTRARCGPAAITPTASWATAPM